MGKMDDLFRKIEEKVLREMDRKGYAEDQKNEILKELHETRDELHKAKEDIRDEFSESKTESKKELSAEKVLTSINDLGCVYGLGVIGAAIYFISTAGGFWIGVLGLLKALVWPALLVYKGFFFLELVG